MAAYPFKLLISGILDVDIRTTLHEILELVKVLLEGHASIKQVLKQLLQSCCKVS